jgi:tRNA threonylcarbamoyladenosine biosynthesis protein TsaB
MIVLALDSTTPQGSVAITGEDGRVDVRAGDVGRGWSERLPGEVLGSLAAHRLTVEEIGLFAVAAGPGSLTGLRVGIATMQGLALATARPLVGVSALEALALHGVQRAQMACATSRARLRVGAWADARRGEVYSALYEVAFDDPEGGEAWRVLEGPSVGPAPATATRWQALEPVASFVVVGDVEGEQGEVLKRVCGVDLDLCPRPLLAGYVATIARRLAARGLAGPPHAVRPLYVRKPDAVLARDRAMALRRAPEGPECA